MLLSVSDLIISVTLIINAVSVCNFQLQAHPEINVATPEYEPKYDRHHEVSVKQRIIFLVQSLRRLGVIIAVWNIFVIVLMIFFFP
mmetsp:Transcript_3075/g.4537  ORF Transcript_3075/g.4537 Transcript_3075/m.4537 type:complete len:86 (+) Transcript_3075:158-415(+)